MSTLIYLTEEQEPRGEGPPVQVVVGVAAPPADKIEEEVIEDGEGDKEVDKDGEGEEEVGEDGEGDEEDAGDEDGEGEEDLPDEAEEEVGEDGEGEKHHVDGAVGGAVVLLMTVLGDYRRGRQDTADLGGEEGHCRDARSKY